MKAQRSHTLALALALVIALGFGLAVASTAARGRRVSLAAPAAGALVDPRLIVRPHIVRLDITLPHGVRLEGTLAPAIPGSNNIHLVAQPSAIVGSRLEIEATMLGMAMAPARTTLTARGRDYRGALTLPMFGRYRLQVILAGRRTRPVGTISLDLLPPLLATLPSASHGGGNGHG